MNQFIINALMMIAASITLGIWGRLIYSGVRLKRYQETIRSITPLISMFVWFGFILIKNWNSDSYSVYAISMTAGYFVLLFVLIALWRVVILHAGGQLRFILRIPGYRVLFIGTIMSYSLFYLFASGMLQLPSWTGQPTSSFFTVFKSYGVLTVWPDVSFGWPALHLAGSVSLDALLILVTIAGFMGISIVLIVYNWRSNSEKSVRRVGGTAGSGVAVTVTSFSCCSLPVLYPLLSLLAGSTVAESLSFLMVSEFGLVFNLLEMAVLSLMAATAISAAKRTNCGITEVYR